MIRPMWVKGAFLLGEYKNGFMISHHKDSSLPKKEDPTKDQLPWQHHVPVFLVLRKIEETYTKPNWSSGRREEEKAT